MSDELVYTNQTAFTAMRNHVLSMTERCWSDVNMSCLYNGITTIGEDNHCAVGALLKGIKLSSLENASAINYIIDHNPEVEKRIGKISHALLRDCQGVHDNRYNWDEDSAEKLSVAFANIADLHRLKVED